MTFTQVSAVCPDCQRGATNYTWEAVVQIRQRAEHKRTLFWLEQELIKNHRHDDSLALEVVNGGLDFYFYQLKEAQAFVEYIKSIVVSTQKYSKQLHGTDQKNHVAWYQHTFYFEVPSINKVVENRQLNVE